MDKFQIGEVAYAMKMIGGAQAECEIISVKHKYRGDVGYDVIIRFDKCFSCESKNGEYHVPETHLVKKKPPTWEELQEILEWSPNKVVA